MPHELDGALDTARAELKQVATQLRESLPCLSSPTPTPDPPWESSTAIMGILNVTPDSFHYGGRYEKLEDAVARARDLIDAGADIIDIGGESTRPGAEPVEVGEEHKRVVPVVEAASELGVPISIDTRRPSVARAAIEAGASISNDVAGVENPEMRHVIAERDVYAVLMHSIDTPVNPHRTTNYDDVVKDVIEDLTEQLLAAQRVGIDREQLIIDPGIGFGKSSSESFALIDRLQESRTFGCPLLVGHSHKSLFEETDSDSDTLSETVALSGLAADRGADILRVHDIPENTAAVNVELALDNRE